LKAFDILFASRNVLTLLAENSTKVVDFIHVACEGIGLNKTIAEDIWNQLRGIASLLSNSSSSLFENRTYTDSFNNTVFFEDTLRDIVNVIKGSGNENLTTLFSESAEPIINLLDTYTHDPNAGIDVFLNMFMQNFTVNELIGYLETFTIETGNWIKSMAENGVSKNILNIFDEVYDLESSILNWIKEHRKITFNDLYFLVAEKHWDYGNTVRLTPSTTLYEAFEFFPKNICNLKETWDNIGRLKSFSFIHIMLCFVADKKEVSSRRALDSSGHIFRNGIDKIMDVGPKFDDGSVQLSDLGSNMIIDNVSVVADTVNNLTLSEIIRIGFNKNSSYLSQQILIFTRNLRGGNFSFDNFCEMLKALSDIFIKSDVQEIAPAEEKPINVWAVVIICICVAVVFALLIVASIFFRKKYLSDENQTNELSDITVASLIE
jgi:hypothetical protein